MQHGDEILAVERTSYAYLDRFVALDDVSVDVRTGELLAILGANGCGKSTLLKTFDGLVEPSHGSVRAFGRALDADQTFRRRVAFVFQGSDAQLFCPTVRDELAFGPVHLGVAREQINQRVDDVLALLDLHALADRAPYQLSGGEKKRVAIGSVLTANPDVLLLDEPTAALDPRTRVWLERLLVELHNAGKTIVCATHDLDFAARHATRCIVMTETHRVGASGTPAEILTDTGLLTDANLIADEVFA